MATLVRNFEQGLVNILSSGKIFNLEFDQYFAANVFVEVMKLNLGQDSEARFGQYFEF